MRRASESILTEREKRTIAAVAAGAGLGATEREEAKRIYEAYLPRLREVRGDPFFEFMSELLAPVPDYGLRATYRMAIADWMMEVRHG